MDLQGIRTTIRKSFAQWRTLIVVGALLAVIIGGLAVLASRATLVADQSLAGLDRAALETEKLRAEVQALQQTNADNASPWHAFLSLAPLATVAVGGFGLLATIWKQIDERQKLRRQEARESERADLQRFDATFAKVVENLGSDNAALQASAVVSLMFLLTPEYARFHDRVLLLALATAKAGINYSDAVGRLFVSAIEKAIRVRLAERHRGAPDEALNLARVKLDGIDLSDLDLTGADIAFASLHHANLTGSTLFRARGYKVELADARLSRANLGEARLNSAIAPKAQFHNAGCVSIRLEKADLTAAQFYQARLQESHLEGANLTGAVFDGANLNNAYFTGATFDETALQSIATGALNWRKAHFDPAPFARLRELGDRPPAKPAAPPELDADGDDPANDGAEIAAAERGPSKH